MNTGHSEYHHSWYTKIGSIGIDRFGTRPRWSWRRGRVQERELRFPISRKWTVAISSAGKSYRELVDAPKELENLDWVIDEFDHNFNSLAIASLKYHLNHSVCNNENRREQYEDIIKRLSEPDPKFADNAEEQAILDAAFQFPLNEYETPESKALMDRYHIREEEWQHRVDRARHDFVDIMRGLWS